MKVETPQILWNAAEGESSRAHHCQQGKALNAALNSIDLLASGLPAPYNHVLVTAGNSSQVNVWQLLLTPLNETSSSHNNTTILQRKPISNNRQAPTSVTTGGLDYKFSLGRDGSTVSCCKFSPDGLVLAVASDAAGLQLYMVPREKRGGDNGRHFWSTCTKESDLNKRIVSTGDGTTDLSWSADGQRLLVSSVDHSVCLVQQTEPDHWQVVYRSSEHQHFVQGVAYDPLGVYLASMSNDRSVRLYPRKATAKTLKKVLKPLKTQQQQRQLLQQQQDSSDTGSSTTVVSSPSSTATGEPLQATSKENSPHAPSVQQPPAAASASSTPADTTITPLTAEQAVQDWLANSKFEVGKTRVVRYTPKVVNAEGESSPRHAWFADEATLESYFRRLAWTSDGHYLICPAALYQKEHAALVFARHNFDEPHKILSGLQKPAVCIRPNPILFEMPAPVEKENTKPYRNIFCVLTWDSVVIYDTHSSAPLALISGCHYANLTDAAWSKDGHSLVVSSSDGYVSLIRFEKGELGTPVSPPASTNACPLVQNAAAALTKVQVQDTLIPPTDPGPVQLPTARPAKKAKLMVEAETTTAATTTTKRDAAEPNILVPKKKKRIQPTLAAST